MDNVCIVTGTSQGVGRGIAKVFLERGRIKNDEWWQRMMIEGCPLGRVEQPEEIGEACLFPASPAARCMTGVVLPVDGGWSIAKFLPKPRTLAHSDRSDQA